MSAEKPKLTQEQVQAAAAALPEVVKQSLVDRLATVQPADLVGENKDAEVRKGTMQRSSAWVHAPGYLELLAVAERRLERAAELAGIHTKRVERVYAKLVKESKLLILKPAPDTDLNAYPINRWEGQSGAWVNLFPLLAPAKLTVETGWRERFEVAFIPPSSPVYPGLAIDLSDVVERRQEPKRKKKGTNTAKE